MKDALNSHNRKTAGSALVTILLIVVFVAAGIVLWRNATTAKTHAAATQTQLDQAKNDISQLQSQLDEAKSHSTAVEKQLNDVKGSAAQLQTQLDETRNATTALQQQLNEKTSASTESTAQLEMA